MRLRCSVPTLDAKDSRENEDLPEDCDQCRRQTGKQRSEEDEEQEGTEEEEEGGRVLTNREVVRTTGEAKTNSEDTQGQDGGALEGERIVQVEHETITAKQLKDCKEQFTFLLKGGTEAEEQRDVVTEREAHLQQIINCLIESRKQEQALWEKQYSELQETIHTSRLVDLREQMTKLVHLQIKYEILEKALFGLSSENEKFQVHLETTCGVQNMLLNEERRGLEKALEEHKSQVEIMAEQLKVYESDFEKERAQREKLFAENDTLKVKNILLQQESSTVVAFQQVSSFELVQCWYLKTIEHWLANSAWRNILYTGLGVEGVEEVA
eukprot:Em0012g744a